MVALSSVGHKFQNGPFDFEDLHYKNGRKYTRYGAYGQSKAANILFTKELAERRAFRCVAERSMRIRSKRHYLIANPPIIFRCAIPDLLIKYATVQQAWFTHSEVGYQLKHLHRCCSSATFDPGPPPIP